MNEAVRKRCLILNADGIPLSTWPISLIPAQEAIHALYRDRLTVIENWPDLYFHSPSTTIPVPKVAILREYAPISAKPKFCRRSIFLRDAYRCQYCGAEFPPQELTFDHLRPRSKGGTTTWENVLTACISCNAKKKDDDVNFSGRKGKPGKNGQVRPLKVPRQPTTAELLRSGMRFLPDEIVETWADYLYWNTPLEE